MRYYLFGALLAIMVPVLCIVLTLWLAGCAASIPLAPWTAAPPFLIYGTDINGVYCAAPQTLRDGQLETGPTCSCWYVPGPPLGR